MDSEDFAIAAIYLCDFAANIGLLEEEALGTISAVWRVFTHLDFSNEGFDIRLWSS